MTRDALDADPESLGDLVATTAHEAMTAADRARLNEALAAVDGRREAGDEAAAADWLLAFWGAYLASKLTAAGEEVPEPLAGRVERAFETGALGIDLYQALSGLDGADDPEGSRWLGRVHVLTVEHHEHIEDHHR